MGETNTLESVKIAVTVDELMLWDGAPIPSGYSRAGIVKGMIGSLRDANLTGVYGFAHTSPLDGEPGLRSALEDWVDAGHHLGNHTHAHACLNWVDADTYLRDIELAEQHVGDLVDRALTRYFRYAMDMSGPTEERRGRVEDGLRALGYQTAPIGAWFGDYAWIVPYYRAIETGDQAALAMLRASFVAAAPTALLAHVDATRAVLGRDIPYVWLIHGTPITQDCLGDILRVLATEGVQFVSLEEALRDVAYRVLPPVSPYLRNHVQRLVEAAGREVAGPPPEVFQQILTAAPMDGPYADTIGVYDAMMRRMSATAGGTYEWDWTKV